MSYLAALETPEEIDLIKEKSLVKPQVIFKHSTRCSISSMALSRIDKKEIASLNADFYLLNIIRNRQISNLIEKDFRVIHESPQLLIIKNGICVYNESHSAIRFSEVESVLNELN
ncbi:MAG: bacillithiol system redox-active protein YtxJ [Chitinophagaceae bacterium]